MILTTNARKSSQRRKYKKCQIASKKTLSRHEIVSTPVCSTSRALLAPPAVIGASRVEGQLVHSVLPTSCSPDWARDSSV